MERSRTEPWAVADAPAAYVSRMVDQIVGIEVPLRSLEGKFKLGQNRTPADRRGLAAGLGAEQPDIAAALRRLPGCPTDL
jgi:transcriptional regulator